MSRMRAAKHGLIVANRTIQRQAARFDRGLGRITTGLAVIFVVYGYLVTTDRSERERRDRQDGLQANVRARFDDCQDGNDVRRALRDQVAESKRNDPILYRLIPNLNTPEIHQLVARSRARQLIAFKHRDCLQYALEAVPKDQRESVHLPKG